MFELDPTVVRLRCCHASGITLACSVQTQHKLPWSKCAYHAADILNHANMQVCIHLLAYCTSKTDKPAATLQASAAIKRAIDALTSGLLPEATNQTAASASSLKEHLQEVEVRRLLHVRPPTVVPVCCHLSNSTRTVSKLKVSTQSFFPCA